MTFSRALPGLPAFIAILLSTGCNYGWKCEEKDIDGDGYTCDQDCWEAVDGPAGSGLAGEDIHAGVAFDEPYDGVDQDCDGWSDYDADRDGVDSDGHGSGTDCDDADPDISPATTEIWYDGVDQDCDGANDYDQDGDGFELTGDCDDEDPTRYPNESIEEIWYNDLDEDCDGNDGDQDGDGYVDADYAYDWTRHNAHRGEGDCWDDPTETPEAFTPLEGYASLSADQVSPVATETWYDGIDQDCDGQTDFDQDGDGYNSAHDPDRDGDLGDDCVDGSTGDNNPGGVDPAEAFPGAEETWYDGTDQDCAGDDDYDQDLDGYQAEGYGVGSDDDCDDTRDTVNVGQPNELCDTEYDDDCDDSDNDAGADGCTDYYVDADGDGFGSNGAVEGPGGSHVACLCEPDDTYVLTDGSDCDDENGDVSPDADEIAGDEVDQDCDETEICYVNADGDGYRTDETVASADQECGGAGEATRDVEDGDCDDSAASVYPGAAEVCGSGLVEDCDLDDEEARETCMVAEIDASQADSYLYGSGVNRGVGSVLAPAGDVDGDGRADVLVTASGTTAAGGQVYLLGGSLDAGAAALSSSVYTARLSAAASSDDLGRGLAGGEDLDGEGGDDLLLGAPGWAGAATGGGGAWLLYGPVTADGSITSGSDVVFRGGTASLKLGTSVATGDVDDDGAADAILGASGYGSGLGAVYVVLGPVASTSVSVDTAYDVRMTGDGTDDNLGTSLSRPSDVDGDGVADLLVGAPGNSDRSRTGAGKAALFLGPLTESGALVDLADLAFRGGAAGDAAGTSLCAAGDMNDDGYADLLIGAPGQDDGGTGAGAAYLLQGAAIPAASPDPEDAYAALVGGAAGDAAGSAVSGALDVNGDGRSDLLVGAPGQDDGGTGAGAAYLSFGPVTGTVDLSAVDVVFTGGAAGDALGTAVSGLGDTDGDGWEDLGLGAPGYDYSTSSNRGALAVFSTWY